MWSTIVTAGVTLVLGGVGLWATFRKNASDLEQLRAEHALQQADARQRELERAAASETGQRAMFDKRVMDHIDRIELALTASVGREHALEQKLSAARVELEESMRDAHRLRDQIRDLQLELAATRGVDPT